VYCAPLTSASTQLWAAMIDAMDSRAIDRMQERYEVITTLIE
jgi:hypothetical protein